MTHSHLSPYKASPLLLALAWFAAPVAWAGHLALIYAVAGWACEHDARWTLHVITLAALLLAAVGVLASRRLARHAAPDKPARRFIGHSGLWLGLIFVAVILMQSIPIVIVETCR